MPRKKTDALTEMELIFITEYLKDFNATRSARVAGYDPKKPHNNRATGCRLLKKPKIQKYIQEFRDELKERSQTDLVQLLTVLKEIATAKVTDYIDPMVEGGINVDENSPNLHALQEYTVNETIKDNGDCYRTTKIKMHNPIQAIERIAKITGLDQPEQQDVSVKVEFVE